MIASDSAEARSGGLRIDSFPPLHAPTVSTEAPPRSLRSCARDMSELAELLRPREIAWSKSALFGPAPWPSAITEGVGFSE